MGNMGTIPATGYESSVVQTFSSPTGTSHTMTYAANVSDMVLVINNVIQEPTVAFTTSGTTLTTATLVSGDTMYIIYLALSIQTVNPGANTVDETKLKDNLGMAFTEVVVTAADSLLLCDATDSGNNKRDTVQGILDLAVHTGNIAFPATQVASANANTLDDYEEGTWTPAWLPSGGSWSGTFYGHYVKIGKTVTASMSFTASGAASGSKMNGLQGLPFTSANAGTRPVPAFALKKIGLSDHHLRCVLALNSARVDMGMQPESNGSGGEFTPAHTATDSKFYMTITYEVP